MTILPLTRAARWAGPLALSLLLGVSGCDSVLEANDPDIVTEASSAAGAVALRNGVILRFNQAMDGGGDAPDGFFLLGGLMADEWVSGDSFEQRNTTDWRTTVFTNSFLSDIFRRASRVRNEGQAAIIALRQFSPIPTSNIGQMFALIAFAENQISEFFCNGIPFSELDGNNIVFGDPVPYDSGYARAVNHADSALAFVGGPDSAKIRQLATVIKARALLNRNQHAAAAAIAATVATSFQYLSTHSVNSTSNVMWLQAAAPVKGGLSRYVLADNEGTNGLNFRSAGDPRLPLGPIANAFDNSVQNVATQGIWQDRSDPVIIASGIEARLIEAEAALRAGNNTLFLQKLNDARVTKTGLAPLSDPGSQTARENLLFRERAFWLFSTGHRLGDFRRLIRQYGRTAETVFPIGVSSKGTPYGQDVNFPIPQSEQNNPKNPTAACTDRLP
jgi:hypothetical protein